MWETITVAVVSTSDQRSQLCFSAALHRRLSCETTARDSIQNDVATFATRTYDDDVLRRITPVRFKTDYSFEFLFSFMINIVIQ